MLNTNSYAVNGPSSTPMRSKTPSFGSTPGQFLRVPLVLDDSELETHLTGYRSRLVKRKEHASEEDGALDSSC